MKIDEIKNAIKYFETILKVTEEAGVQDSAEIHRRMAIKALNEALQQRTKG